MNESTEAGTLYVVATPIGNLDDMSPRATRILCAVDLIAAEDTRHSRHLLDRLDIKTPLTSYHEHNEMTKASSLIERLLNGQSIALISDAGTPCVSDPGYHLVHDAREAGLRVESVAGPCAAIAALSISGLPSNAFSFHGFCPRKQKDWDTAVESLRSAGGTHIFYESPKRLHKTLVYLGEVLPEATVCVARELTKLYEEVVTGTPADVAAHFSDDVRGECVLLLHVSPAAVDEPDEEQLRQQVRALMQADGLSRRDAVRCVAETSGVSRKRVYAAALEPS